MAGEASGDLHGANFLRALRELVPGIHALGVGGPKLRAAGLQCLFPAEALSIVGLPSLKELKSVFWAFAKLVRLLKEDPPNLLVLIDFPEFNLWLARVAKRLGVPVFYYIGPQVWAWRRGRVRTLKKTVDAMAVVLPFEVDFYAQRGLKVHFVGHPLLDVVKPALSRKTFFKLVGLAPEKPLIGLFPGSRPREIQAHVKLFQETFALLKERLPSLQGVFVRAEGLSSFPEVSRPGLKVIKGYQYEVMAQAEVVLLASGTVTLEAAIVGTPMVVTYRLGRWSYYLARLLVKVPYVSLVNLVAGEEVAPEFIQHQASPENLSRALARLLEDQTYARKVRQKLKEVRQRLGPAGAAWRAAELAAGFLRRKAPPLPLT